METTPILVTGATGNAGAALAQLLVDGGHSVRAAARAPRGLPAGAAFARFDFTDPSSFEPALQGVRRVFLLRPPQLSDVKRQFDPFLRAMVRAGVEQVCFLSLLGAERNPFVPHRAIEERLVASGLGWTMLRCGFFMQNLTDAHRAEIRDQSEIIVPAGRGKTSFIDVRDIAAVAARTLTEDGHLGRAYPLTGAVALDYFEVASVLSQVLGRRIVYKRPSLLRFARHNLAQGGAPAYVAVMAAIYTTTRLGMAATLTPDAARLLGRPPRSLRAFAADHRALWA